ncbi:MAG: alkyl sulfatase C-terminal domain-containing protein, partial [Novosphingobium sp.]
RQATLTVRYADLLAALFAGQPLAAKVASGEAKIEGDPAAFARLVSWLDKPDPAFAIVTP